jgi:hypothetical protein
LLATATPAGRHAIQWFYEQLDGIIGGALRDAPQLAREDVVRFAGATGAALAQRAQTSKDERP